MIDLTKVRNYYIACGYTDLRLGIDGLAAIVTQQFGGHLDEESLFLFCGRRTDRIKALYWSGDGYILLYKRLSNGRFQWPRSETELRLLDPPTSESRMWVYASGERSEMPVRLFEYQPDRSGKRPESFLRGFTGCLVTDGYAGYNQVQKVIHCGCWAHMKRKWREAMPDGATVKTSKAAVGFQYCNKLFSLEKKCAALNDKLRKEYRQNFILPILEEYFCWVNTLNPEKGSKLADAVTYARNQKSALCAFAQHGNVPISNNLAENAIRPFAVGRKNWLFCDTVKGAESSAIVYSLVETAKANGLDPYDYLLYALSVLPYYGKSTSHEMLETAMPWSSEVQRRIGKQAQAETK